jgi:hypothetical protein
MFAILATDGAAVSVKATREAQAALLGSDPAIFTRPAYVGVHGWVGVNLPLVDPGELRELVVEAWLLTAPKRLASTLPI